eukprot:12348339-Alexandrium_andersonii.AAC.1
MSASLVGSEMCIRDSHAVVAHGLGDEEQESKRGPALDRRSSRRPSRYSCLLYTSDAADDM